MRIGEAAAASGISERMIRHYEKIGLVDEPARRDSGYRDYGEREVRTLQFIGRARDLGFSIDEIAQLLALWKDRSRASAEVKALALARAAELKRKERELQKCACRSNIWRRVATATSGPTVPSSPASKVPISECPD